MSKTSLTLSGVLVGICLGWGASLLAEHYRSPRIKAEWHEPVPMPHDILTIRTPPAFDDTMYSPMEALQKFQQFTLSDGVSYFRFARHGAFSSGPLGECGRTLEGTWKTRDGTRFTVIAKAEWMNGKFETGDYRRIEFHISHLRKLAPKQPTFPGWPSEFFEGYYCIDEFVKTEKP